MSDFLFRRGLLAPAVVAAFAATAAAQQTAKLQGFASADAAAAALTEAVRGNDKKAVAAILGPGWLEYVLNDDEEFHGERRSYLAAWDDKHSVTVADGDRAVIEVGKEGWTFPIPIVKDGAEWRFDGVAGDKEVVARQIGHDELGAIQTMLAIVDAQYEYARRDPMKTGWPQYARRLMSTPGRKDGLYWPAGPDQQPSPLGKAVAEAQLDGAAPGGHFGYNFRLLYGQGAAAHGGAHDYLLDGRMIGGFGAIAWPLVYGDTGIMTFIVGYHGIVYQQDFGPDTAKRAGEIAIFNPDQGWERADTTLP